MSAIKLLRRYARPARSRDWWRTAPAAPAVPRAAWPVVCQPELARRAQIEQPGRQHAVVDDGAALVGDAFAVERPRAQAALPVRIVDDGDRLGRRGARRACPSGSWCRARSTGRRSRRADGAEQAARHARIEHHRTLAGRHLAGAEPLDRALAGARPTSAASSQIAAIDRAGNNRSRAPCRCRRRRAPRR